jgi:hypothetical protein
MPRRAVNGCDLGGKSAWLISVVGAFVPRFHRASFLVEGVLLQRDRQST